MAISDTGVLDSTRDALNARRDDGRARTSGADRWSLPPAWLKLLERYNLPKGVVFVLLGILIAITLMIAAGWLSRDAQTAADNWFATARHANVSIRPPALSHPANTPDLVKRRLDNQLSDVRGFAALHLRIAKEFSVDQFILLTLATGSAAIAALLLFPVTWRGWKEANGYLLMTFLSFAVIAIVCTSLTQLYRLQANIDENKSLYLAYLVLEDEILSYYPVGQGCAELSAEKRDAMKAACDRTPAEFIRAVDARMGEIRNLAVAFDPSKSVTVGDVYKQLNSTVTDTSG
jgi:hypothetical protein